jgi:hypothetical protein
MSASMPHEQFMISIVAIGAVFGLPFLGMVIWMVTHYACATFKAWQETSLKRDMVARGYSVQEIVEVISAKRGSKPKSHLANVPPAKPIQKPAFSP